MNGEENGESVVIPETESIPEPAPVMNREPDIEQQFREFAARVDERFNALEARISESNGNGDNADTDEAGSESPAESETAETASETDEPSGTDSGNGSEGEAGAGASEDRAPESTHVWFRKVGSHY